MSDFVDASSAPQGSGRPRMMLLRAAVAQNIGSGCAFGGFSVSILALQDRFGSSLAVVAMAMTLVVLSMSGLGPLVAVLIRRFGLRRTMCAGLLLSVAGYATVAVAPNMMVTLAACAVLIGPGSALFGALPPAILASGWYPQARGWAVGITYTPLFLTLFPLGGLAMIHAFGLTTFFLALAGIHLVLLPLMLGVAEAPETAVLESLETHQEIKAPSLALLASTALFWLIVVGDGILNGTAIAGSAHMMPIVTESGSTEEIGAVLLSVIGGASILGSVLAGFACDRFGAARTLGLSGLAFAIGWTLIETTHWLPAWILGGAFIGMAGAAVFPPITTLVAQVYGTHALPKILGFLGVLTLPFTLSMVPAAGWLRDLTGGYTSVIAALIILCSLVGLMFFGMNRHTTSRPPIDALAVVSD